MPTRFKKNQHKTFSFSFVVYDSLRYYQVQATVCLIFFLMGVRGKGEMVEEDRMTDRRVGEGGVTPWIRPNCRYR